MIGTIPFVFSFSLYDNAQLEVFSGGLISHYNLKSYNSFGDIDDLQSVYSVKLSMGVAASSKWQNVHLGVSSGMLITADPYLNTISPEIDGKADITAGYELFDMITPVLIFGCQLKIVNNELRILSRLGAGIELPYFYLHYYTMELFDDQNIELGIKVTLLK